MDIRLTWFEVHLASEIGCRRHLAALQAGLPDRHGAGRDNDGWTKHVEGAAGEMAVAKALNLYYDGSVNTFRDGADVGRIQVRTRSEPHFELLVRDSDADADPFLLVTGRAPSFRIVGWMYGGDAKQEAWRHAHGGREAAYFVPHVALEPLEKLRQIVTPARVEAIPF